MTGNREHGWPCELYTQTRRRDQWKHVKTLKNANVQKPQRRYSLSITWSFLSHKRNITVFYSTVLSKATQYDQLNKKITFKHNHTFLALILLGTTIPSSHQCRTPYAHIHSRRYGNGYGPMPSVKSVQSGALASGVITSLSMTSSVVSGRVWRGGGALGCGRRRRRRPGLGPTDSPR